MKQVVIYSKPGCRLCQEAAAQLQKLRRTHPFDLREVNILSDAAVFDRFQYEIPVVLIDGVRANEGDFDARRFLEQLEEQRTDN